MKIETDLNLIKRNAKLREKENLRFRAYLKGRDPDKVDAIVHALFEKVAERIDCTECANCCIELETSFRMDEIDRMSEYLQIDKIEFINQSTKPDEYGEKDKFVLNSTPCQFLKDNKCTIYPVRPEECRSYPHLQKDEFIFRLFSVIDNYEICPIVYNVYELLKQRFNFR